MIIFKKEKRLNFNWKKKFAWYPIKCFGGIWVWLEIVKYRDNIVFKKDFRRLNHSETITGILDG